MGINKVIKHIEIINNNLSSNGSNGRTMLLLKCAICNSKKLRFIKN